LMDNEIYGLTKGQVAPTTPTGDKTKSTYWGNPEPSVDPCELAISTGATWVGRGFSGDVKTLTKLITAAISHHGFAFLNVMSPCVTWRGDDQFKVLKQKLQYLPEDYDPTRRRDSMPYTRETDALTTGVLFERHEPSLVDRLDEIKMRAAGDQPEPTTREILETFFPKL
jgi:2-oxoglutarate ferredoxin oxidoreductase subunit beta